MYVLAFASDEHPAAPPGPELCCSHVWESRRLRHQVEGRSRSWLRISQQRSRKLRCRGCPPQNVGIQRAILNYGQSNGAMIPPHRTQIARNERPVRFAVQEWRLLMGTGLYLLLLEKPQVHFNETAMTDWAC